MIRIVLHFAALVAVSALGACLAKYLTDDPYTQGTIGGCISGMSGFFVGMTLVRKD